MAADEKPAPPVQLRIKVRYEDPDAFVERFAPYVGRAGLFLRSKTPKPVGSEVRFELRLADDKPVLVGMGIVRWMREPDPEKPSQVPGMAIEFTRVTKESRGVILKMLELRRKLNLVDGPRGLPMPPDDDVAVTAASTASATAVDVRAKVPDRPRRPTPAQVIAAVAAAPMADAFGEMEIEEARLDLVLERARVLIREKDVDAELTALLDAQAAPIEITADEASAALSKLFGTAPIPRRRADDSVPREARPAFAPPPKVALAIAADLVPTVPKEPEPKPEPGPQPEPAPPPVPSGPEPDEAPTLMVADPEPTRVVNLEQLAKTTGEGETRVVHLQSLVAETAVRDDDERTRIVRVTPVPGDDDRTHIVAVRDVERAAASEPDDLDFDHRKPEPRVPREFAEEPDQDTMVRMRPTPLPMPAVEPPRPTRRTTPPPTPPPRNKPVTVAPPPVVSLPALDDDETPDSDDDALTPPPVDPETTIDVRGAAAVTSSGSIDLDDLVAELEGGLAAPPVSTAPPRTRSRNETGDLGRSLEGEALDAAGLIADFGVHNRRRAAPEGPFPDLASFADPPSISPRGRGEALDATLAALDGDDAPEEGSEERTQYERPPSHPPPRARSVDIEIGDDDSLEIEIELDE